MDLLEVGHVTLDLQVQVVVDEAEETVDDVDDSVCRCNVGLDDSCLYTVVTHVHCDKRTSLTYLLTIPRTRIRTFAAAAR